MQHTWTFTVIMRSGVSRFDTKLLPKRDSLSALRARSRFQVSGSSLEFGIWDLEFPLTGVSGLLFIQNRFKEVFGRDIPIKGNLFDENLSGHLPVRVVVAAQRGVNSLNGMPICVFRFLF